MLRFSVRAVFGLAVAMSVFGLLILSYAGKSQGAGAYHFFTQQAGFLVLAIIGALILYACDYHWYRKPAMLWLLAIIMVVLLMLVLVPGIGKSVNGSRRWIGVGAINVQPVEFVKLLMVVFFAGYLDYQGGMINRFFQGRVVPILLIGAVLVLLLCQPDFGGAFVVCFLAGIMLLIGGIGWKTCAVLGLLALVAIAVFVGLNENRMARLHNDNKGENYQANQSKIAFCNGGILGAGLGKGMQKERYLPECHTDFIFAIIGEDLGFVATSLVWASFLLFLICGVVIAFYAPDKQGMLLAFGATMMIAAQAAANMAVVTHLFPTKGLALPFFSYGGSCLLATFSAVGVLWSVGRVALDGYIASSASSARKIVSFN
ncbi:MAG: FtsW/RodA/SpoVE family cell cycle protein [Kiritimatiellia bacterium]